VKFLRCSAFILFLLAPAWAAPLLNTVKVAISNSTAQPRIAAQIVVSLASLRAVVPDLNAGSLIVTVSDGKGPAAQADELPSQVDDLDGDGKADELAFEIDLKPSQTRVVTVTYGEPDRIFRLRSEYLKHTNALFANKIEGLGWESEKNAWRLYFDPRNAIDLYGKRRDSLFLETLATPEYNYHADSPYGRDIYKVGDALGIGAVGAWVDGKLVKVSDVSARKWRVISSGPVRSIIEITYEGWKVGGRSVTLRSRIEQWAGDRGFYHSIKAEGTDGITFATGLPRKPQVPSFRSDPSQSSAWLATYGEQVVKPGPTATEELPGTNLGLAVVLLGQTATAEQDNLNYLLTFVPLSGSATWYVAAAWDEEGINNGMLIGSQRTGQTRISAGSHSAITTKDVFLSWLAQRGEELKSPAAVKVLSEAERP